VFYVGYTVSQIPNNIILRKVSPRIFFSGAMIVWGIFTLGMAFVKNWHQIMALRFCEGLIESATFVGTHYTLGSWYNYEGEVVQN
jgi:ACS family pantothenate transporter-like MFS transporter